MRGSRLSCARTNHHIIRGGLGLPLLRSCPVWIGAKRGISCHVTGAGFAFSRPTIYGPGLMHTLPARVLGYEKGEPEPRFIADSSPPVRVHTGRGPYRLLMSIL